MQKRGTWPLFDKKMHMAFDGEDRSDHSDVKSLFLYYNSL